MQASLVISEINSSVSVAVIITAYFINETKTKTFRLINWSTYLPTSCSFTDSWISHGSASGICVCSVRFVDLSSRQNVRVPINHRKRNNNNNEMDLQMQSNNFNDSFQFAVANENIIIECLSLAQCLCPCLCTLCTENCRIGIVAMAHIKSEETCGNGGLVARIRLPFVRQDTERTNIESINCIGEIHCADVSH